MKSFRPLFYESSEEDENFELDLDVYELDDEEAFDSGMSASEVAFMQGYRRFN